MILSYFLTLSSHCCLQIILAVVIEWKKKGREWIMLFMYDLYRVRTSGIIVEVLAWMSWQTRPVVSRHLHTHGCTDILFAHSRLVWTSRQMCAFLNAQTRCVFLLVDDVDYYKSVFLKLTSLLSLTGEYQHDTKCDKFSATSVCIHTGLIKPDNHLTTKSQPFVGLSF